jgi:WD40 repeat protein
MSPCGDFILSGSKNGELKVWNLKTKDPEPICSKKDSHLAEINGVDWSRQITNCCIASSSDDCSVLLWDFDR